MNIIRLFINSQRSLSNAFDRLLPLYFRVDGNADFANNFAPAFLHEGLTVYDIGGGKSPYISVATKAALKLSVVGLDIADTELHQAPEGAYDRTICADICDFRGEEDADLVICQTLLEHVVDVDRALKSISSVLKPGGKALLFAPSRKAVFARLNKLLPQSTKTRLLHTIFPESRHKQGFPAYYDRCTAKELCQLARDCGLVAEQERSYFSSGYFSFFFPAHVLWRLWLVLFRMLRGNEAAETFAIALCKQPITDLRDRVATGSPTLDA